MNLAQAKYALEYLVEQGLPFQLTGEDGVFTVDIKFSGHGSVLQTELNERDLGPIVDLARGEVMVRLK